ncbi:tetratricopeptide repeat protein, partial [Kutzneria viridogrisea]
MSGAGGRGSGYLLGDRLAVTSAHVVTGSGGVTVFRPGRAGQVTGQVVWCGTPGGRDDAALVLINDPAWQQRELRPVVWGRSVTHQPGITCRSWGVPDLAQRDGNPVEVLQPSGTLNPGDRMVGDRYVMNLDGAPPVPTGEGRSPWGGMSGAAMFCHGLLTGVIAADPAGRGHAVLEAVPAYVLLADPAFVAAVSAYLGPTGARCEAVELQPLAAGPLPGQAERVVASPAGLLAARRAVVPFHGREDVLTDLHTWAALTGLGVVLLHGAGGQGKTRLALEFTEQLTGLRWAVLWLRPDTQAQELAVLAHTVAPVVVVVDYAESRMTQLAALADVLARRQGGAAVKVLLLARTVSGWWEELTATGDAARDFVDTSRVHRLTLLDRSAAQRVAAYQVAVTALAEAVGQIPGLTHLDWSAIAAELAGKPGQRVEQASTVLAVQMAALADLLDTAPTSHAAVPLTGGGRGPEDRILDHERGYWRSTATAQALLPALGLDTLTDIVAATVVLGPGTVKQVDGVLARVPELADQPVVRRNQVRTWLTQLYPPGADGAFEGLVPDRVAERLIGRLILDTTRPCVIDTLLDQIREDEAERVLTVCTRAAAHSALGVGVGERVTQWCLRHTDTLLPTAAAVATQVETPAPLLRAIERVTADSAIATSVLERLIDEFPARSQVLASAAAEISMVLVQRHRQAINEDPSLDDSQLATHLNDLSIRLGELGRWEEGLATIIEAVEILRRLAEQRPEVFLPDLAMSLNNLAIRLGESGQREEALMSITEAVQVYRRLAEQRPEVF